MESDKFLIQEIESSTGKEIKILNKSNGEFFSLLPHSGGRLKELFLYKNDKLYSVLKKIENIESDKRDDIFLNAKLSPFAGRIENGNYNFADKFYQLELNYPEENNACHGFLYNKKFELVDKTITDEIASCTISYNYNIELDGYPFDYTVRLTYSLINSGGIKIITHLTNNSDCEIPISDGWHNYFTLEDSIDNLDLEFETSYRVDLKANNIPSGNKIIYNNFKNPKSLKGIKLDDCFKLKDDLKIHKTKITNKDKDLNLHIWQQVEENKYNYLVIYTPPDRKSIAIEPMTSNVNSFNNKDGLIILSPNKTIEMEYGIYLS